MAAKLKREGGSAVDISFRSAKEFRGVLDTAMRAIDADPDVGPRLRSAAAPLRFEFPDLKLALNVYPDDAGCLRWDFAARAEGDSGLRFTMDSDFANRLLQGRENPAIAIARGRLKTTVSDAGAALSFFVAARPMFARYRAVVVERYPHLAVE